MRRTGIACLAAAGIGLLLAGCRPDGGAGGEVLVRHHFAGVGALEGRPDLVPLKAILARAESRRLLEGVSTRLAAHLPEWFGAAAEGTTNQPGVSPALIRDLLASESYLEVEGTPMGVGGWALAARVDPATAARTGAELRKVLQARLAAPGTPSGDSVAPGGDWTVAGAGGRVAARFGVTTNGWIVVGTGDSAFDRVRSGILKGGPASGGLSNKVLRLEADLARVAKLAGWWSEPPGPVAQWPAVDLSVEPRGGKLRTEAALRFARPLELTSEPWRMPTEVLREPLVGFTAVRGADTWVGRLGLLGDLGVREWPRQLFLWSLAGPPWQQYFAGPIGSPTNLMVRLASEVPMRIMTNGFWKGQPFGLRITNQASRIEMHGLPYFQPFVEARGEAGDSILHGGLFRLPSRNAPPPTELLSQVSGRTNLVLYDWETTGQSFVITNPPGTRGPATMTNVVGRLTHFKHLYQYLLMSTAPRPGRLPSTAAGSIAVPGGDWIDAVAPALGDSVTEVTRSGVSELAAVRLSQTGFTAFELIHLLRWIENPGFPGWQDPPPAEAGEPSGAGKPAGSRPVAPSP